MGRNWIVVLLFVLAWSAAGFAQEPPAAPAAPEGAAPAEAARPAPGPAPSKPKDREEDRQSGLVLLGGAGYMGILKEDRPSFEPGAYIGAGPLVTLLIGYQGASSSIMYRIGGGYIGSWHKYRHQSGGVWGSRIPIWGDLLWNPGRFRLGGRMGLGLGLANLGDAYEADNGKSRTLLGLYIELGLLLEYAIDSHMTVGLEPAATVDGWTGEDPNKPGSKATFMSSLGGFVQAYFGYRF